MTNDNMQISNKNGSSRSGTKSPTTSEQYGGCPNSGASPSCLKQRAATHQDQDLDDQQQTVGAQAEIEAAVQFISDLIKAAQFSAQTAEHFRKALTDLLKEYYDGHWYPDEPLKGSGYRCLRVNGVMNPLLKKAAQMCNMPLNKFRTSFPVELTVWVDPGDVSVRFGEEGSIGVYYARKGVCLKHDHQQMEEFQRLTTSTASSKRASPHSFINTNNVVNSGSSSGYIINSNSNVSPGGVVVNNGNSSRSSPAPLLHQSSYGYNIVNAANSMKIGSPQMQQSPPRKILPFLGGRHTPTMNSAYQQQVNSQQYASTGQQQQQQQSMMFAGGYGASPEHHHHFQQPHHYQSPNHHYQQLQYDMGTPSLRRPSPSPSPPSSADASPAIGDWWKSEYHQMAYGGNGSAASRLPHFGRFGGNLMNACARQEPVGAN